MGGSRQLEVVWFKRDLRVSDHAPLAEACARARAMGPNTGSGRTMRAGVTKNARKARV